jgi:hypothetical protein
LEKLARDVRFLKMYSGLMTLAFALVVLTAFRSEEKRKFEEIDVQRLNVIEPNGKLDLAISDKELFPAPVLHGKVMKRSGDVAPGMIFFNGNGEEQGGMLWTSDVKDGKYRAGAGLLFDQYNQDQTVGLMYDDDNGKRAAGVRVWDHPETPITDIWDKSQAIEKMKPGPERDQAQASLREEWGAERVFVGKQPDKSAVLLLSDAKGRTRIKLAVDSNGNPSMTFLDEAGKVTFSEPPGH